MTVLKPAPVSTGQFHWEAADRVFVAEISSTHGFGRVYDDACDLGLTLVSRKTGREMVFAVDHETRDHHEGDVLVWTLTPVNPADRAIVSAITLFND